MLQQVSSSAMAASGVIVFWRSIRVISGSSFFFATLFARGFLAWLRDFFAFFSAAFTAFLFDAALDTLSHAVMAVESQEMWPTRWFAQASRIRNSCVTSAIFVSAN